MQLTSGSTGSPKAVQITHRNIYSNAEAMFISAEYDVDKDVMVSWLPCFHDMGMVGFLTIPMYFGAELVKVTPMDFLRDTLLWARLIDKYKGTMTAAPNFAYALFAKRLRRQAKPGEFVICRLVQPLPETHGICQGLMRIKGGALIQQATPATAFHRACKGVRKPCQNTD